MKTRRPDTRGEVAARADPRSPGQADAAPESTTRPPAGQPLELADVYREHSGFVWRIVRRLGIPDAAVEDVMHDVFMVVHRRLPEYDGRAAMTTWLFHIARGVASNYKRGKLREGRRLELVQPKPAAAPDPERHAEQRRAADFVRTFIASLDEHKRRVFELAEVDGLPVPQVAEICEIKLNTAYSRLRAARRQFAQAVAEREQTSHAKAGSVAERQVVGGES